MNEERKTVSQHIPSFELLFCLLNTIAAYAFFVKPKLNDHDKGTHTGSLAIRTIHKKPLGPGKLGGVGPKHYT